MPRTGRDLVVLGRPVCLDKSEGRILGDAHPQFEQRNCKIIGLSVDPVDDHSRSAGDIEEATGCAPNYPPIGDSELKIAKLYNMLPEGAGDSARGRTPVDNQTVRTVYVIGPDKLIKAMICYPMSMGGTLTRSCG